MFDLNHNSYRHRFNGGVQFRLETMDEDSGVCSPPLWRNISPPDSPVRFPNSSKTLSPASRAQAIARGQREMMEMVECMPETSYELSLKDIVEQRSEYVSVSADDTQSMEEGEARLILKSGHQQKKKNSVRRQESSGKTGRIIVKNGSMNNNNNNKGLLINMFFPFSIGTKKKNYNGSYHGSNSNRGLGVKSSPKTELMEKTDRRDWWKKFTDSANSDHGLGITSSSGESTGRSGSSGSSGSSTASSLRNNSDRRKNGCTYGCWSLFPFKKKKS